MTHRIAQPPGWPRVGGDSDGAAGSGELLATAGEIGEDRAKVELQGLVALSTEGPENTAVGESER